MKHYHYNNISSTNDFAKELLDTEHEVIVTADYQWAGRGRNERTWEGSHGLNIYCSVGLKHSDHLPVEQAVLFQAAGCLAVKSTLKNVTGSDNFRIKYPNDVLALRPDGTPGKISGILAEHGFLGAKCIHTVLGMGINIRQTTFSDPVSQTATSLLQLGFDLSTEEIIPVLIKNIKKYTHETFNHIFELWREELKIEGKNVSIVGSSSEWLVEKLMDDGRLLLVNSKHTETRIIDDGDSIRYNVWS